MTSSRRGINTAPIPYEDRVIRYARRQQEAIITDRNLAQIARDTGADLPPHPEAPRSSLPGDAWKLRGIPVVGGRGGVGGAIPGTRPDTSL